MRAASRLSKPYHLTRPAFPEGWSSLPLLPRNLTLAHTLPVGQSFLWHRHELDDASEEFSRAVDKPPRVICLRQTPEALFFTAVHSNLEASEADRALGLTRQWLESYFQLDEYPSLDVLYDEWRRRDSAFFGKIEVDRRATGVRVLRQDPWECLLAFITSTNNHIPRISSLLHRLCERFSPPLLTLSNPNDNGATVYYVFPRPEHLPQEGLEQVLRELGFGYRAGYLESAIAALRKKGPIDEVLDSWRRAPLAETRANLIQLKGVGRKVADCVMLMCMDKPSVIPIDTHIHAIASKHPSLPSQLQQKRAMSPAVYESIQTFLAECWGPRGGWCQAVVFASNLKLPPQSQVPGNVKVARPSKRRSPSSNQPGNATPSSDRLPKRHRGTAEVL